VEQNSIDMYVGKIIINLCFISFEYLYCIGTLTRHSWMHYKKVCWFVKWMG